jgi:hypothetical protein
MKTDMCFSHPLRVLRSFRGYIDWGKRAYAAPSPTDVKHVCLLRNGIPGATWVETGTYLGHTTEILSRHGEMIYSIEPEPKLFENARRRFGHVKNIEIINGASEDVFPTLLPRVSGNVNFWLDGHYSGGITFKGLRDTPITDELAVIADNLGHFRSVCVLVDDVRCFGPSQESYVGYPSLDFLVDWARSYELRWHIEHDIFIAKRGGGCAGGCRPSQAADRANSTEGIPARR